ncbi:MAG TPA: hypothetical protein VGR06_18835 [Actinophytocola sp.]|jgi:hypothetical protein|uniref:hypothetical protein n=1 Tax=Actinophytocola sp. TaxID=1872138 RepID=UPI002DF7FB16|nr:hypothetical protein [Actinophytocola sp.]
MTDLHTLTDAFTELERRADAVTAGTPFPLAPRRTERPRSRLVPVAATVVAVAGLAAGVALLAPGDNSGPQSGSAPPGTSTITQPPTTSAKPPAIPRTPEELADRFRAALGGTATFTVTDSGAGAAVVTLPPPPAPGPAGGHPPGRCSGRTWGHPSPAR